MHSYPMIIRGEGELLMSRKSSKLFVLLLVLALTMFAAFAVGCASDEGETEGEEEEETTTTEAADGEDTDTTEAGGEEETVVLGFTVSQTGSLNVEGIAQLNGIQMWMEDLNEAGGIELSDGTTLKLEAKFYDDESSKDRVQELYTRLATEDDADFLISPYSSGLAAAASVIAEQYGKLMITTGAASDANYKQGYQLVFQAITPASSYMAGAVDLLAFADPDAKKIAWVNENSDFSLSVVDAAREYAESEGYETVLSEGYSSDTSNFGPLINKIGGTDADAVMGGGHFQDGSTLAKQLHEKDIEGIKFVSLLVAPAVPSFADLGDAAVGVVGPSQWEPSAKYSPEAADELGIPWIGISGEQYASDYEARTGEVAEYHSAEGYAAGLILEKGIRDADSIATEDVKAALEEMDMMTFFGRCEFDSSDENHGLQIAHTMVYNQWQKDESGDLVKEVVWPESAKTTDVLYPIK